MKKCLLLLLLLLPLTSCDLGSSGSGGEKKAAAPVTFELVPIQSLNDWYMSVGAYDPSAGVNSTYLFDYTEAQVVYEHDSCSNHTTPAGNDLAPGKYVDVLGDLNQVDPDTGAIKAQTIFVHNTLCLELAGVELVQPQRTIPR